MLRPRLVAALLLALLLLVLVVQNTEVVAIKLFFWEFEASRVILITLTALIGLVCGFLLARIGKARSGDA